LKSKVWTIAPLLCGAGVLWPSAATHADAFNPQLQKQRMDVLAAGQKGAASLPMLEAAMKSSNALIRRAAIRSLAQIGAPAQSVLLDALKHDKDLLVRRSALRALAANKNADPVPMLEAAMSDENELVRATAVSILAETNPRTPQVEALLKRAQSDKSADVSLVASQAMWPAALQVDGVSLREKPEFKDSQLSVVQTIPLALDGWRFQTDAGQIGHTQKWFAPTFNDAAWKPIKIGKSWEEETGDTYDGVAWYRTTFKLPEKPAQVGTDLVFDSVDESAWVWINGQFVGQHDIGPDGWNQRFAMDVSPFLKWGEDNQITVRVLDRMFAGGIYKPVYLEVLKK
jgi:hypothetical protein